MTPFRPSTLFKYLVGVLLVQATTAVLVVVAVSTLDEGAWVLLVLLSGTTAFFAALWFASIADHGNKEALSRARERFAREREKIRVDAERDKHQLLAVTHQRAAKESGRTQAKANFKVGTAFAGALGVGAFMLLTQLFTIGLLVMTTAGGALAGYLVRAHRDHRLLRNGQPPLVIDAAKPVKVIRADREPTGRSGLGEPEELARINRSV